MLTIRGIEKLKGKYLGEGWHINDIATQTTRGLYLFQLTRSLVSNTTIDSCTISIDREGRWEQNPKSDTKQLTYYFRWNSEEMNVCGTLDWLADVDNFISQLTYIIDKKHNK